MSPSARVWALHEIRVGASAEFERDVTEADVLAFAQTSGDFNPLHVDADYARQTNYGRRIVHGAYQVGLASALIGMHLPGRDTLLMSINARFPLPLYYPSRVRVRGEVTAWNELQSTGQLKVTIIELASTVVTSEIHLAFSLHKSEKRAVDSASKSVSPLPAGRPTLLITGAAGELGRELVAALAEDYSILALVNRASLDEKLRRQPHVKEVRADLGSPSWEKEVLAALGDSALYGVVHAAWPALPRGGLLETPDEVISHQLIFGSQSTIHLARLLFARVGPAGGRLVAIGSIAGLQKPAVSLSPYSLGKSSLDLTIQLLAPELAGKNITANTICPSLIPVGMTRHVSAVQIKLESAKVPLGRLCSPGDVTDVVRYLLSPQASFLSGQSIALSGGQL